ncbi:MAG: phospholipid carrier-dependent glycosyltransferase [Pyrinomonadaceae bacterium]|nr:phospholipid carrier-dependent glycosyltransferase [Pyrinomonadaceae bacterium]
MGQKSVGRGKDLYPIIAIAALVFVVFFNSISGEFVYDDKRQVLRNQLIQQPELFTRALTSDVWAFKGDGTTAVSNYWRPTFTAYSIFNYLLFGPDPLGWHLLNVLLHALVSILVFLVLRRLEVDTPMALAIAAIFAVHPVHTESVAWIAGSPDILFGLFILLSIHFFLRYCSTSGRWDFAVSVGSFVLALGAKEVALLCIPVYLLLESRQSNDKKAAARYWPTAVFAAVGGLFFLLRWIVLGEVQRMAPGAASFGSIPLTAPTVLLFYLKQSLFPLVLGPNYPLRPIEALSLWVFAAFLIAVAAMAGLFLLAKKTKVQRIGLALFVLPLIPAFLITSFIPEQIVHDRYLYLPVLGLLMILLPELRKLLRKLAPSHDKPLFIWISIVLLGLFSLKTANYNRVWANELSLWQHSVTVDQSSAFNYMQLGSILYDNGRIEESIDAYNESLNIKTTPRGYLGRARGFISKGKFEEAIKDLKTVAEMPVVEIEAYELYQVYESLAISYVGNKEPEKAIEVLRKAIIRLPIYRAALTEKLAIVLYQSGEREKVRNELESVREQALREMLPESKHIFFRLGLVYLELGEKEKGIEALRTFLKLTANATGKTTLEYRKAASETLQKIN